ncbi:MAG: M28 family peptidase [Chloracidobacterium sp.]|nr:M28 family peptidase [Chloracidobacterium sp.]
MRKLTALVLVFAFALTAASGQDWTSKFNATKMRERVIRLSADDLEGRGPGTAGGKRAAQYIADQLKASGVRPGNGKSYFQNVKLVGVKADPETRLTATITKGPTNRYFDFGDDFVVTTGTQTAEANVNAEVIFVGYGIDAPLYNWNDYKGDADQYKGKVLMIMVNDPPATDKEPDLFGGKALTYYGRWTYKYEEAARRGAAGVILVHTDQSAGYGWNVVRTSNGNWRYELARGVGDKTPFLPIRGWMTNEAAEDLAKVGHHDLDDLRKQAQRRDFKPVNLGVTAHLNLKSEVQTLGSPNVVGIVDGSDPKLSKEFVVITGHWDHLGIGSPDARDDKIFNGAYDNASGVSAILGIADILAKMPKNKRPKRSILFLFTTAEEQGLLGAEYYSHHPLVPLAKTAANVNIDGVNFFGKTEDFSALGVERSTLMGIHVQTVAAERSMTLQGDMRSEQGFFFRSDHFPFAKVGVPAISLRHGSKFTPALTGDALNFFKDYTAKYYHQPSDEYKPWWNTEAMVQNAELGLAIAVRIANERKMPRYDDTDEFAAADKKRFK